MATLHRAERLSIAALIDPVGVGQQDRILSPLEVERLSTFHLNEGHAGFLTLELLREQGYEDLDKIKDKVVFVGDANKGGTMADATLSAYENCWFF